MLFSRVLTSLLQLSTFISLSLSLSLSAIGMGEKVRGGMAEVDMGEGMQCSDHPYRSNPGGICAFCLQEKLGKLVSSSKSSVDPFFSLPPAPSSSSSPPTFISSDPPESSSSTAISFLSSKHHRRRHKKKTPTTTATATRKVATTGTNSAAAILKRCKSVAPRPIGPPALAEASDSPRKKSFWSFLTLSYSSSSIPSVSTKQRATSSVLSSVAAAGGDFPKAVKMDEKTSRREHPEDACVSAASATGEDDISPSGSQASSSFGRKVSRSRSVGCGSRSFSGDFLERISNGFGDCTLRRVESHRESKSKAFIHRRDRQGNVEGESQIKERVKCGGFFGGLGVISSATYWLSATADVDTDAFGDRPPTTRRCGAPHGRSKSWAWAFSSPMRAFRPAGSGSVGQTTVLAASVGRGGSSNGSMLVVRGY